MKMLSFAALLKAVAIAISLGIIGYIVFPTLGLDNTTGQNGFLVGLTTGALLGSLITAIRLGSGAQKAEGEAQSIFVGNLAFKANQQELRELFSPYGTVHSVRIMTDRATRRPRGFGFVEMDSKAADKAIKELDGYEFLGRKLRVNVGSERKPGSNKST
jgi:hypothetical protein